MSAKATHMKVYRGFDPAPSAYCGAASAVFNTDGVRATCKRCWNRHERVMAGIRSERLAREYRLAIAKATGGRT